MVSTFKKISQFPRKIPRFLKEVRSELKKVSWSTREELMNATWVVILASALLTAYIAGIDVFLSKVIQYFLK